MRTFAEPTAHHGSHRLAMLALSFFGVVATLLSAAGLYAVVSLTSRLRRREYAIRLAVGAEPGNVRRMVIRQGMTLGALGVTAGVALAAAGMNSNAAPYPPTTAARLPRDPVQSARASANMPMARKTLRFSSHPHAHNPKMAAE